MGCPRYGAVVQQLGERILHLLDRFIDLALGLIANVKGGYLPAANILFASSSYFVCVSAHFLNVYRSRNTTPRAPSHAGSKIYDTRRKIGCVHLVSYVDYRVDRVI